jgi:carbonic anhydrase
VSLDDLLDRNRRWAEARRASDPGFFDQLARGQQPRLLWIGCSDSRVPAEEILGCGPGELFVHRNVANLVADHDLNLAAVLQYATEILRIADVVVCGHYGCGGILAACAETAPAGELGEWLAVARQARLAVDRAPAGEPGGAAADGDAYHRRVVEENVRLQVLRLGQLDVIRRRAGDPAAPRLHGWAYDIATGLVKTVVSGDT